MTARAFVGAISAAFMTAVSCPTVAGAVSTHEFNVDGTLPSSQGASYFSTGAIEGDLYSVSGGLLHQNSAAGQRGDYYVAGNIYDANFSVVLEWRVRLFSDSARDAVVMRLVGGESAVPGQMNQWFVNLSPGSVSVGSAWDDDIATLAVGMDTTDTLHTYRLVVAPRTANFDLYVDNVLGYSGVAGSTVGDQTFFEWGNINQRSGHAEWDYVRFFNTVPEPASGLLCGAGLLFVATLRRRQSRNAERSASAG